jgi:hypothetical protein
LRVNLDEMNENGATIRSESAAGSGGDDSPLTYE